MALEQVWGQATKRDTPWKTGNSEWIVDVGAKIEKFIDGKIVIKNTISRGDNYTNLTSSQLEFFKNYGWDAGRYNLCVAVYQERYQDRDDRDLSITEIAAKINHFETKLKKALEGK